MGVVDQYRALLKKLLPPGAAFNRGTGTNLSSLLDGMAEEPARVHDRVGELMLETMPDTTTEMLAEWETAWGLPDQCTGALDTLAERRAALLARMAHVGQQSPGFFVRVAATLGYSIVTEENVGGSAYVWRIVSSIITAPVYARAGSARSGDPIRTWGGDMLECAMRALNPAHLDLLFAYIEADIAPALVSATIWPDGQTLALAFNQALSQGVGYSDSDFSIDGSLLGSGIAVAYVSGSGTGAHLYTVDGTIRVGETVTLTFTGGPTSLVRSDGAYLEPVSDMAVFNGSEETEAPPSIVSATINAAGNQLTVVFSEAMSQGAGYQDTDINLDGSLGGTDIGLTYVSGSGTDTWVFSIATVIRLGETVDLDFIGRSDGIEDADGNDLAAIGSMAVTNNSKEDFSDIVFWDGFDGTITDTTYEATNYDYPAFHTAAVGANQVMQSAFKRVGSKSIYTNAPYKGTPIVFTLPTPVPVASGRVGFWSNCTGGEAGIIMALKKSGLDEWWRVIDSSDVSANYINRVNFSRAVGKDVFDGVASPITFPIPRANTWVFLEIAWDRFSFGTKVLINGLNSSFTSHTPTRDWLGSYDQLIIGPYSGIITNGLTAYTDNLIVSTDPTRDLYALALLEACPRV